MAEYRTLPVNKSFLSNNKFDFTIKRLPNLTFFVQGISLPEISLNTTDVSTPFTRVSLPGNQLSYGQLNITYIIDENMESWFELYNWMNSLGNPESFDKRGNLTDIPGKTNSVTSDAALIIKTNANNPNIIINFKDVYPASLSDVTFTSTETQEFLTTSCTFSYTHYIAGKI